MWYEFELFSNVNFLVFFHEENEYKYKMSLNVNLYFSLFHYSPTQHERIYELIANSSWKTHFGVEEAV